MRTRLVSAVVLATLLLSAGCGTMSAVRPLRRGASAYGVSYGGPVARLVGMDMPFPYLVARYRYGVTDRYGIHAALHATTLVLGVAGFDAGMSYQLLDQHGALPAVGAAGGITGYVEPGGPSRLFPNAEMTTSWLVGRRWLSYLGAQAMFQLDVQPHVVLAPVLGQEVRLGNRFSLALEAKWYAPTEDTEPRNVDYRIPVDGKGAVGFALGANWHLGGWYE